MATQTPWAVLLCRYSNDYNDPFQTHISDLYSEWESVFGGFWISQNMSINCASDNRTIMGLYQQFFTSQGYSTFNIVRYWNDMSHGNIDTSTSEVFPCILDITKEQAAAIAKSPGGRQYQNDIFKKAKSALQQQYDVDWKNYFGVIVSFQTPDHGAQGGWFDGGPGVFMDIRHVVGNGTQVWGHEMGHAYGLDHSRADCSNEDYMDPWDMMSTKAAFSTTDPLYGMRGPGLNAWNMRGQKWLDESRVWKGTPGKDFNQAIQLRPLHKRGLNGYLAAELPSIGNHSPYLIEFRVKNNWDAEIPAPGIIVHRLGGADENGPAVAAPDGARGQAAPRRTLVAGERAPHVSVVRAREQARRGLRSHVGHVQLGLVVGAHGLAARSALEREPLAVPAERELTDGAVDARGHCQLATPANQYREDIAVRSLVIRLLHPVRHEVERPAVGRESG